MRAKLDPPTALKLEMHSDTAIPGQIVTIHWRPYEGTLLLYEKANV